MADNGDLVVPELGESITEAVIGRWLKKVGESVDADEPVVDLETDKITVQLPSPVAGALKEQRYSEGDTVKVGDVVGLIAAGAEGEAEAEEAKGEEPEAKGEEPEARGEEREPRGEEREAEGEEREPRGEEREAEAEEPEGDAEQERDEGGRRLSPSERRARRNGRSRKQPEPRHAEPRPSAAAREAREAPRTPEREAPEAGEREEAVKMSPLRKRIAQRLVEAQQSSASLTTFNEVDMSAVMALRKEHQEEFVARHGLKLGFMSFFVKAAIAALRQFPGLNAEMREDTIVYKKFYDIGIAVSTDRGLVVPVLRDADQMSFAEIEQGIIDLATKARDGKLQLSDLTGASFTITNGGIFGSMMSTPLLNYPQTGILGMHNIVKRAVVGPGDELQVRPMMYLAVTYDHRVVDGKESVQFLVALKKRVENPDRLLFDL